MSSADKFLLVVTMLATTGAGVGALVKWVVRPLISIAGRVQDFLRDWYGEEARPGHPRRPGVPEQIRNIERHVGNGSSVPLRQLVEEHQAHAEQEFSLLHRLARKVGMEE